MKPSLFLVASFALVAFSSCQKDKEKEAPFQINKTTLSGTYALGAVTVKIGNGPEQDQTNSFYDPCEKDDRITLKMDNKYDYTDAGVKCNPPGDDDGTWDVIANNTKIVIDGEESTISSFDGKTLKLTDSFTSNGQTVTYTITLNKQ